MSGLRVLRLCDINDTMENSRQLAVHLLLYNTAVHVIPLVQSLTKPQRLKQQQALSPMNVLWEQHVAY